jgi:pentatricopeptide repeat protein
MAPDTAHFEHSAEQLLDSPEHELNGGTQELCSFVSTVEDNSSTSESVKSALEILLDCMEAKNGAKPDLLSINAAISACEKGGLWLEALELLEYMKACDMEPNLLSLNAAIIACEKGGQRQRAQDLLEQAVEVVESMEIEPDITLDAVINECEKRGGLERWFISE